MNGVRFDFRETRVLVTGGTSGIGHAVARAFADAGARVTVTGTRAAPSDYDVDLGGLRYLRLDVRDDAATARIASDLDGLDVLVNNAGANFAGNPGEWDPARFDDALHVNLSAPFRVATACRPLLRASTVEGGASVINVASLSAERAVTQVPGYGAAKAGVLSLTRTLAVAWAADGIRVNAVVPGLILTRMTQGMRGRAEVEAPQIARTPLARWGEPDDLSPTFLFLASAAARFVTGTAVTVDGGYLAS